MRINFGEFDKNNGTYNRINVLNYFVQTSNPRELPPQRRGGGVITCRADFKKSCSVSQSHIHLYLFWVRGMRIFVQNCHQ